ncbi:MAG: Gfo/Idh/MocA family oxidoreductase [Firmicutes bacterium]|nr:Gfo/Idh/MocA family oxidoreductase [Bacillota bacterium]
MSQFKAAVVGLGGVSPMHTKSLQSLGIQIVSVCDKDPAKAKAVAKEFGAAEYTNYVEMLDAGGFDVLHICLPHFLHAPVAVDAMQKGYHVLTEKPMATTIEDAEKMITAAKENNVCLGVIFQNRYSPGAQLIKEALESGQLGPVKGGWIRVTWHRGEGYYLNSDWRGRWATEGGGVLINQSIHSFDMMNYFLGNPTYVSASIANRAHPSIEVEDVAEGVITYGQIPISFFVNTYHPYDAPASVEIICENGKAVLVGEDAEIIYNDGRKKAAGADKAAQQQFGMKSYWGVSHVKQIHDFYRSAESGKAPAIDGEQGLRTQRLINGIYESAKSGKRVDVSPSSTMLPLSM